MLFSEVLLPLCEYFVADHLLVLIIWHFVVAEEFQVLERQEALVFVYVHDYQLEMLLS